VEKAVENYVEKCLFVNVFQNALEKEQRKREKRNKGNEKKKQKKLRKQGIKELKRIEKDLYLLFLYRARLRAGAGVRASAGVKNSKNL
jgi:hypothetical protein